MVVRVDVSLTEALAWSESGLKWCVAEKMKWSESFGIVASGARILRRARRPRLLKGSRKEKLFVSAKRAKIMKLSENLVL